MVFEVVFETLGRIRLAMLLGTVLMALSVAAGWVAARWRESWWPVRCVDWWLTCLVMPLLRVRRWSSRTIIIFVNNALVLGSLVASGRWHIGGRIGVVVAGLVLGIAIHRLGDRLSADSLFMEPADRGGRRRVAIGVALNLLEVLAIIVSLGLAIGRTDLALPPERVWSVFLMLVVPWLLVAAGGEALWMGVTMAPPTPSDSPGGGAGDATDAPPFDDRVD